MAYFAILLNDAGLVCAGDSDICVLSADVIVMDQAAASLGVHGMRETRTGMRELLDWVSQPLLPGETVQITYLLAAEPTAPRSTRQMAAPKSRDEILADLKRIFEEMKQFEGRLPIERKSLGIRTSHPRGLRVSLQNGPMVNASLGEEDQLQAVLKFTPKGCELQVDSLTVLDGGHTKGTHWLREQISPGCSIQITYAT